MIWPQISVVLRLRNTGLDDSLPERREPPWTIQSGTDAGLHSKAILQTRLSQTSLYCRGLAIGLMSMRRDKSKLETMHRLRYLQRRKFKSPLSGPADFITPFPELTSCSHAGRPLFSQACFLHSASTVPSAWRWGGGLPAVPWPELMQIPPPRSSHHPVYILLGLSFLTRDSFVPKGTLALSRVAGRGLPLASSG